MEEARPKTNNPVVPKDPSPQTHSNKRKLSHEDVSSISFFKIRAIMQQLRPNVIQVLQTPDFRNCKAAHELRNQMKVVMDIYNQMTRTTELGKFVSECKNFPDRSVLMQQSSVAPQAEDIQPAKQPSNVPADRKPLQSSDSQIESDNGLIRESYVVGGSTSKWNFITWAGNGPVYYGVTKELYRNAMAKLGAGGVRKTTEDQIETTHCKS